MIRKSGICEELKKNKEGIFTNVGSSMMPLLREKRDLLHIRAVSGPLKKYDVPLYRRDNGQYVLHRILKVRKEDYLICGDNRWAVEKGITDRHIIGVLTGITRDGKYISVDSWKYKCYVHLWCDLFPLRAAILYTGSMLKRLRKKYKKGSGSHNGGRKV